MLIGALATSDEMRAFTRDSSRLGFQPCLGTSESVAFCHVGVVAQSACSNPAESEESPPTDTMSQASNRDREDVLSVVRRYVQLEFSIRSAAGRLAIDESRVSKDASLGVGPDCSDAELRSALRVYLIRNAVYAKPEAPEHQPTPEMGRVKQGKLHRVAPLRDVAPIVRPKSSRGSGAPQSSKRDWRASVGQKLQAMAVELIAGGVTRNEIFFRDSETNDLITVLEYIERTKQRRIIVRNQLQQARTAEQRIRSGGRNARNIRRHAEDRVRELRSLDSLLTDRIQFGVRSRAYRRGVDALLAICTATPEIERDIFGEVA